MNLCWIPNLFTFANLFFGVLGLLLASNAFYSEYLPSDFLTTIFYSSCCIVLGGVCDFFDGFFARLLRSESEIGKGLDSFADLVTFGVLPSIILQKLLVSYTDFSSSSIYIKFLILSPLLSPCFVAYRLARFNTFSDKSYFEGLSSTAFGLLVASIVFSLHYSTNIVHKIIFTDFKLLLSIIGISNILMISKIRFMSLKFNGFGFKENYLRYFYIILSIFFMIFLKFTGFFASLIFYIIFGIIMNVVKY